MYTLVQYITVQNELHWKYKGFPLARLLPSGWMLKKMRQGLFSSQHNER